MGSEIERIVDRKSIRGRVHYLVVWRGFGDENNTWESRMDLVADGYSNVIRDYENSRKDSDDDGKSDAAPSRSPSRGRSPGRAKSPAKTPAKSAKSPGRPRGRPRSESTTGRSPSATREKTRRRSKSKNRESAASGTDTETSTSSRRRSSRKSEKAAASSSDDGEKKVDDDVLRKTLEALEQPRNETKPQPTAENGEQTKKAAKVELSYEESVATTSSSETVPPETSSSPKKAKQVDAEAEPVLQDLWTRLNEGNWLLWFISAVVIALSLLASQMLPQEDQEGSVAPAIADVDTVSGQWRHWLPFLTPVVALLLVFHQRDERSLVKWIAIALSWRIAAELSLFFEFAQIAVGAASISYTALIVALVSMARSDDLRSKSTLALFVSGALALALSDSWIVQTQNVVLASRVNLMSASVLSLALSPVLTATSEDD